jgi:His-Xaa-Ser system protein HxsD
MPAETDPSISQESVIVRFDPVLFNQEIVLKGCYWLSRDFVCEITSAGPESWLEVLIKPKQKSSLESLASARDALVQHVTDFALREKIDAKTTGVRDLLLAKAFSESGVLEDLPTGVFGDRVEETKPDGMFKILSDSEL